MKPLSCGLVLGPRSIVAVLLGERGLPRRAIRAALTDDARSGLVAYLAALDAEIVVTDDFLHGDDIAHRAVHAGLGVSVVPAALLDAICRAAAITDPARAAGVLARLPRIPFLRAQIRRLRAEDHVQAALL